MPSTNMSCRNTHPKLHEKSIFHPWAESMLGRQLTKPELKHFDVKSLLGTACLLEIEHETSARGRAYGKVVSLVAAPQGVNGLPDLSEDLVCFFLSPAEFSQETFDCLPSWEKDRIETSEEWIKMVRLAGPDKQAALPAPSAKKRSTVDIIDDDLPNWD
jgi:hypothetical protein